MNVKQWKRITLCLSMGGLVLVGLVLLLDSARGVSYADGAARYVAPGGTDLSDCKSIANVCETVQHAIDVADLNDTIWVAQGTYTGTGLSVITVTKTITLYGGWDGATEGVRDPDTYPTILDGEGQRRVVLINGSVSPTIDGFIITGGNASGSLSAAMGGGIYSDRATPIIANNVVTGNVAYTGTGWGVGGGIAVFAPAGVAVITGNQVISNVGNPNWGGRGGGIYLRDASSAQVVGNVVLSNTAGVYGTGYAGGVYLYDSHGTSVIGNRIEYNNATLPSGSEGRGGGVFCDRSTDVTIGENVIRHNAAHPTFGGLGGGVYLQGCDGATVFDNLLQNNGSNGALVEGWGGAICATNSAGLTIDANHILSNTATYGGGVAMWGKVIFTMTNNIVASNESEYGGGMTFFTNGPSSPVTGTLANNTFVANNRGTGNGRIAIYVADPLGGDLDVSLTLINNLIYSHTYGVYVAADSDVVLHNTLFYANSSGDTGGPGGITNAAPVTGQDPLLDGDYHLQAGSPAVNRGISVPWLSVDIDGDPRPDWCFYDIGVDETVTGLGCQYVYVPLVQR